MSGGGKARRIERVLEGIAVAAGLGFPIKINMVVQRGVNDGEVMAMAAWARERHLTLRFIEFMDVGNHNGWSRDLVVPATRDRRAAVGPMAAGALRARLSWRGGRPLSLSGWRGRDRTDQQCHGTVLPRLPSRAPGRGW